MVTKEIQNQIIDLTKRAGKILLDNQNKIDVVKFKDRQDIATNIDLKVEDFVIRFLKRNFPDDNIDSEERGFTKGKSNYTWLIDPIDGTKHYLRKLPYFTISIALKYKSEIILGLVHNPVTKELFYASKGKGAYRNGKKIKVSGKDNLKDAFVYTELPSFGMQSEAFNRSSNILMNLNLNSYRVRAFGLGSIGLCYVASGAFEAYITLGKPAKLYDLVAGLIIVKEAGGRITNLSGEKITMEKMEPILASNGKVHNSILKLLK